MVQTRADPAQQDALLRMLCIALPHHSLTVPACRCHESARSAGATRRRGGQLQAIPAPNYRSSALGGGRHIATAQQRAAGRGCGCRGGRKALKAQGPNVPRCRGQTPYCSHLMRACYGTRTTAKGKREIRALERRRALHLSACALSSLALLALALADRWGCARSVS